MPSAKDWGTGRDWGSYWNLVSCMGFTAELYSYQRDEFIEVHLTEFQIEQLPCHEEPDEMPWLDPSSHLIRMGQKKRAARLKRLRNKQQQLEF